MKRTALIVIFVIVISTLIGCSTKKSLDKDNIPSPNYEKSAIPFKIIQSSLTKNFDTTEPAIGVKPGNDKYEIRVSPGPVLCSSFEIDKLEYESNTLTATLSINQSSDQQESQVYNPVIIFEVSRDDIQNLTPEDIKLINSNFKPLGIPISKKQASALVLTGLSLTEYTEPAADIVLIEDRPMWNITFNSALEINSKNIVKAVVTADGASGKIVNSKIDIVGEPISKGILLSLSLDDTKLLTTDKNPYSGAYQLSNINLNSFEENTLYHTIASIKEAYYSPDNSKIALTETNFNRFSLFVLSKDGEKINSISNSDNSVLKDIRWNNNNELYYLKVQDNKSTIFMLNTKDGSISPKFTSSNTIENFEILDSDTLVATFAVSKDQRDIHIIDVNNGQSSLAVSGQSPVVVSSSSFIYASSLQNDTDIKLFDINMYDRDTKSSIELYNNRHLYSYGVNAKDSVYLITSSAPSFGYSINFTSIKNPGEVTRLYIPSSKALIDDNGKNAYIQDSDNLYKQVETNVIYKFYLK